MLSDDTSQADPKFRTIYKSPSVAVNFVPSNAKHVLDVGCGTGVAAAQLKESGHIVDGITWNEEEARQASASCRDVMVLDLEKGIPGKTSQSYDAVICSHILEHIAYPQKLISDIHDLLVSNGTLIVVIPNLFFWRDRLKLLRGRWQYTLSGTFDYTHLRWYTVDTMKDFLGSHGFVITHFEAHGWVPLPGLRLLLGGRLREKINRLACKLLPGLFGGQLLFCARKKPTG